MNKSFLLWVTIRVGSLYVNALRRRRGKEDRSLCYWASTVAAIEGNRGLLCMCFEVKMLPLVKLWEIPTFWNTYSLSSEVTFKKRVYTVGLLKTSKGSVKFQALPQVCSKSYFSSEDGNWPVLSHLRLATGSKKIRCKNLLSWPVENALKIKIKIINH